jgi:hypothetical protein
MALRGATYRQELDDLTDEAWEYAVRECLRSEEWFPAIATLLRYAGEYVPKPAGLLVPVSLEEAEASRAADREQKREAAKNGLELIKAELAKRGIEIGDPVKDMPDAR